MYIKKQDKIQIIKWYIKKHIRIEDNQDNVNDLNDLKDLENIVRTHEDCFGKISECKACYYEERDFCPRCANCKSWHWDKEETEIKDNYVFSYGYYKSFYEYENQLN